MKPTQYSEPELDVFASNFQPIEPDKWGGSVNYELKRTNGAHYLRGITQRGKFRVAEGYIKHLVGKGCNTHIAEAAARMPGGQNENIWRLADEIFPIVEAGVFLNRYKMWVFNRQIGWDDHGCDLMGVSAAINIAIKAKGIKRKLELKARGIQVIVEDISSAVSIDRPDGSDFDFIAQVQSGEKWVNTELGGYTPREAMRAANAYADDERNWSAAQTIRMVRVVSVKL